MKTKAIRFKSTGMYDLHKQFLLVGLPWRHLRQFTRGSLRGGASQIQHTSSPPEETEHKKQKTESFTGQTATRCFKISSTHQHFFILIFTLDSQKGHTLY